MIHLRRLLIYGVYLTILACALILSYKHMQGRLNPEKTTLTPSRLENCQNLKINDPKLIAFANKCLIEAGERVSDFAPEEIRRFTEAEKRRFGLELPDEWTILYRSRKGGIGGTYSVGINFVTCECRVSW